MNKKAIIIINRVISTVLTAALIITSLVFLYLGGAIKDYSYTKLYYPVAAITATMSFFSFIYLIASYSIKYLTYKTYDMDIVVDHSLHKTKLYINGTLMDHYESLDFSNYRLKAKFKNHEIVCKVTMTNKISLFIDDVEELVYKS